MERVLVTGAGGFIGSHLTELLVKNGYNVTALVHYNSRSSCGWLDKFTLPPPSYVVAGDIRDLDFCIKVTKDIDIIFHLAALISIPYSYISPTSYVETNVLGTLNICQASRANGIKRLIHTSTSEVYGSAKYVPMDESHPQQPQSPYSASKIAADAMALSFYNAFNLPVTIARPFNTYGPRQSARAVIPSIIGQIAVGKKIIKVGDLSTSRDFNYVEDTCRGFLALAKSNDAIGKTINIGSGREITIGDTLNLLKSLMNSDVKFVVDEQRIRPPKSEVQRLCCDNSLIRNLAMFTSSVDFQDGLVRTIDWFTKPENLEWYKFDTYSI